MRIIKRILKRTCSISLIVVTLLYPWQVMAVDGVVERMKWLIGGGTTPEYQVLDASIQGLQSINTRRLRLINIDNNKVKINASGEINVEWSTNLINKLELCRDHGWVPRLIIGHIVPPGLELYAKDGRKYGPSSWDLYDRYVEAYFNYVIKVWGFKVTEWEVGNEMNVPNFNWVAGGELENLTEEKLFNSYALLYSHISKVLVTFRSQNPSITTFLGGPAVAPNSFINTDDSKNWLLKFASFVIRKKLICDFVSIHMYGSVSNGKKFTLMIGEMRKKFHQMNFNAKFSVSEWGADWHSNAGINSAPVSGAFTIDFINRLAKLSIKDAFFLALSEFPKQKWPALYDMNGKESDAMKAMKMISSLNGNEAKCETKSLGIHCIAMKEGVNITIILWNLDWNDSAISSGYHWIKDDVNISLKISSMTYIEKVEVNGKPVNASSMKLLEGDSEVRVSGMKLLYGDYAVIRLSEGL